MRRDAPNVEWHVAQNDAEWEALRLRVLPVRVQPSRRWFSQQSFRWVIAVLPLLLASAQGWVQQPELANRQPPPSMDRQRAGNQPVSEQARTGSTKYAQEEPTSNHAPVLLERYDFFDRDVVRMLEHPETGIQQYQYTTSGRLRSVLDAAFWGPDRQLETTHFRFHFRQRDTRTVTTVAAKLDALYSAMQHNLGLETTPGDDKLVIEVSDSQKVAAFSYWPHLYRQITVPSPALYPPSEWSEAELLAQSLALPLIDHLLGQTVQRYAIGTDKTPLLDGWRLWQLWDADLPLSTWRRDIVHWVYVELPASGPGQPARLPEQYTALCAMHALWVIRPAQIQIPLLCAPLDQTNEYLSSRLARTPPTQLPALSAPVVADEQADAQGRTRPLRHPGEAVALATVIEYVVATYGREQLPALAAALGQHDSWDTLSPALFGVSGDAFEAGWQAYLRMLDPGYTIR